MKLTGSTVADRFVASVIRIMKFIIDMSSMHVCISFLMFSMLNIFEFKWIKNVLFDWKIKICTNKMKFEYRWKKLWQAYITINNGFNGYLVVICV